MDEEDGRPGALAVTTGHPDARMDALPLSLRFAISFQEDRRGIYPGMAQPSRFVIGHDFSHAANPTRQSRALAPVLEPPPPRTPHIPESPLPRNPRESTTPPSLATDKENHP
jgi:hypothetical protein